jgi:hypothetical protein
MKKKGGALQIIDFFAPARKCLTQVLVRPGVRTAVALVPADLFVSSANYRPAKKSFEACIWKIRHHLPILRAQIVGKLLLP